MSINYQQDEELLYNTENRIVYQSISFTVSSVCSFYLCIKFTIDLFKSIFKINF